MDLASVVAALASVGVRVSGSAPNSSVQVDSSRACPPGLAGPEPSGTIYNPGQHFRPPFRIWSWVPAAMLGCYRAPPRVCSKEGGEAVFRTPWLGYGIQPVSGPLTPSTEGKTGLRSTNPMYGRRPLTPRASPAGACSVP